METRAVTADVPTAHVREPLPIDYGWGPRTVIRGSYGRHFCSAVFPPMGREWLVGRGGRNSAVCRSAQMVDAGTPER